MKKEYLKYAFAAAFIFGAGYGVYTSQCEDSLSHLVMANIEALAEKKDNKDDSLCPNGCVDNGTGCACNGIYVSIWKEYEW
jgi:hypothetical protein